MSLKVFINELEGLRGNLLGLRENIRDVIKDREKTEIEYVRAKTEFEKELLRLQKLEFKQIKELDDLEEEDGDITHKISGAKEIVAETETCVRECSQEIGKINADNEEEKKRLGKEINELQININQTDQKFRNEQVKLTDEETKFKETVISIKSEHEKKIEELRKSYANRRRVAYAKYKAVEEPLVFQINTLTSDIEELEEKISLKPKELSALLARQEALEQKYQKLMEKR